MTAPRDAAPRRRGERAAGEPAAGEPTDAAAPSARRRVLAAIAVLAGYTGLAAWWFRLAWADPANRLVGGCCDPAQYVWYLRWFPYALGQGETGLLSTHVNAPEGINLMWQASSPLLGVLVAPVGLLFGPLVAYDTLATLAVSLSAFTCFLALRRWVGGYAGPVAGGLLFGFSPYMAVQSAGHLNFTFLPLVPLLFLAADDVLVRQTRRWWASGGLLGLVVAAQMLVAEEIVASAALVCLVLVVVLVAAYPRQVRARLGYAAKAVTTTAVTAVALCAYPLWHQFRGPQRLGGDPIRPPNVFVTDLSWYWTPNRATALSGAGYCERCGEESGYLGPVLIAVCLVVAIVAWRRAHVRVAALTGLATVVLSLGPALHLYRREVFAGPLPYALVDRVPALKHLLPIRLPMYVYLAAAVLLAEALRRLTARRALVPTAVVVAAGVAVTLWPTAPMQATRHEVPEFFRTAVVERLLPEGATVLVLPFPGAHRGSIEPMLWQAEADMRFRMPGAYFLAPVDGRTTSGGRTTLLKRVATEIAAGAAPPAVDEPLRRQLLADLDRYGVEAVLVGPHPRRAALAEFAAALVGRPPDANVGGVLLWTDV